MDKYTKETINRVCPDNLTEYTIRTNTQMGIQKLSGQTHKWANKNVRTNTQISKQCPDKHTKGANKQIDRQKDRLTDYSNFNIDKALQAS